MGKLGQGMLRLGYQPVPLATALLRSVPRPIRSEAAMPYLSCLGFSKGSVRMSLRRSITAATSVSMQ